MYLNVYTVVITRKAEVQVYGDSMEDAIESVEKMYDDDDNVTELGDAKFIVDHIDRKIVS